MTERMRMYIKGQAETLLQPLAAGLYAGGYVALYTKFTKCLVRNWSAICKGLVRGIIGASK